MLKNNTGKVSMMRVGFLGCLVVGGVLCLFGIGAVYKSLDGAEALVTNGAMLMSASGFAKAIQSVWENKNV